MVVSNPKPLSIAVLTISDTRNHKTDSSGQFLAESLVTAGHHLHEKIIAKDDISCHSDSC
jgi:molybdenum cofactor biosynthesis protein B